MDEDERSGMVCAWVALVLAVTIAAVALVVLGVYAQEALR